jgi:signal transduction histidine kinase
MAVRAADAPLLSARREIRLSLRAKAVLAVSVVVAFVLVTGLYVANERQGLVRIVQEVESNHAMQGMVGTVVNRLAGSLVNARAAEPGSQAGRDLLTGLDRLREALPALDQEVVDLQALLDTPRDRLAPEALAELQDRERQLIGKMHEILDLLQKRSAELSTEYRDSQRAISVAIVTTHVAAVLGSLAAVLVFFTRIARDIKALQDRAAAIVDGYSGPPLAKRRHDEIGGLIDAVNRMQVDLRRHEQQQEVTRQQRFHQEKMAAVGSIASAIGHEVSNPIAAISGVAQFMVDETGADDSPKSKALHDFAAEILKQSQRITLILRQLGALTTPPSPEPKLLDLNELIQSTCAFIRYDKRFRRVYFDLELDAGLPAVTAVADHLTQILMNLLINAADAMDHIAAEGASRIRIATHLADGGIQVTIRDNGRGMDAAVLAKAFEESFTTKPAGKGRGIGLFLCKTLMEEAGGRIALESTPDVGTTATLFLTCPG